MPFLNIPRNYFATMPLAFRQMIYDHRPVVSQIIDVDNEDSIQLVITYLDAQGEHQPVMYVFDEGIVEVFIQDDDENQDPVLTEAISMTLRYALDEHVAILRQPQATWTAVENGYVTAEAFYTNAQPSYASVC